MAWSRSVLVLLMLFINRLGRSGAFMSAVRLRQRRPLATTTVTSAVGPGPTDAAELSAMTVVQLKARLREAGLPVSGKKVSRTPSPSSRPLRPPPPPSQ